MYFNLQFQLFGRRLNSAQTGHRFIRGHGADFTWRSVSMFCLRGPFPLTTNNNNSTAAARLLFRSITRMSYPKMAALKCDALVFTSIETAAKNRKTVTQRLAKIPQLIGHLVKCDADFNARCRFTTDGRVSQPLDGTTWPERCCGARLIEST